MRSGNFPIATGLILVSGFLLTGYPAGVTAMDRNSGYDSAGNYIDEIVIDEKLHKELATQRLQKKHDEYIEKIQKDPNNYLYHFYLGNLYLEMNRPHEAVAAFKETVRLNPQDGKAHYHLGKAYGRSKDSNKAIEHIETASRIFKENLDLHWHTRARNLLRQFSEQD